MWPTRRFSVLEILSIMTFKLRIFQKKDFALFDVMYVTLPLETVEKDYFSRKRNNAFRDCAVNLRENILIFREFGETPVLRAAFQPDSAFQSAMIKILSRDMFQRSNLHLFILHFRFWIFDDF